MAASRFYYQTDIKEMERRWKVTLAGMKEKGIDCLLLVAWNKIISGSAKYLTDVQANEYPILFLFGEEGISIYANGPEGAPGISPEVACKNVCENIGVVTLPTSTNEPELLPGKMLETLKRFGHKRVGVTCWHNLPVSVYEHLKENGIEFVDFSYEMDEIMAVKSEYELGLYRDVVELHDQLMACAPAVLRAGRKEKEIIADLRALAEDLGCVELNFLVNSGKTLSGGPNAFMYMNRTIEEGDYMSLLIEVAGPGGVWGELGRLVCFGEPSQEVVEMVEFQKKLQAWVAAESKPGVVVKDIAVEMNRRLVEAGYEPDKRFSIHGQGYNIVERPMYTVREPMVLKENMFLAIHPGVRTKVTGVGNCDNYIIKKDGAVRVNRTPADIIIPSHFRP